MVYAQNCPEIENIRVKELLCLIFENRVGILLRIIAYIITYES